MSIVGRPRLLDGIAMVPIGDAWLVEGGMRRDVFSGRVPAVLFGALLPLLDGNHSIEDIATELGVRTGLVEAVVERFREHGLLGGGQELATPGDVFLDRILPSARARGVRRRLARARVAVAGDNDLAVLITDVLADCGVGEVRQPCTGPADLVIEAGAAAGAVAGAGPRLPVRVLADRVVIGPVTEQQAASPLGVTMKNLSAGRTNGHRASLAPAVVATVAGVVGQVVTSLLGGFGPAGARQSWEVDLVTALPNRRSAGGPVWPGDPNPRQDLARTRPVRKHLTEPRLRIAEADDATRIAASIAWYATGPQAVSIAGTTRADLIQPDGSRWSVDGRRLIRVGSAEPGPPRICLTGDAGATEALFDEEAPRVLAQDLGLALAQLEEQARRRGWRVDAAGVPGTVTLTPGDARPGRFRALRRQSYRFDPAPVGLGVVQELAALAGTHSAAFAGELPPAVAEFLDDRELCAPGLVLVLGPDEPESLCAAVKAVREMQVAAARAGFGSGILARMPADLLKAAAQEQVLAGLAVGRPVPDAGRGSGFVVW